MGIKFEVSIATLEDLEQMTKLFNDYRMFYNQPSNMQGASDFLRVRMERNESVLFKAVDNKTLEAAGFMQLYPSFSSISMKRSWVLNDLYVMEEYRGQGAAQQLLVAAENWSKQTLAKGIALSTATDNLIAQSLYERNGYERDQEFYHYYLTLKGE